MFKSYDLSITFQGLTVSIAFVPHQVLFLCGILETQHHSDACELNQCKTDFKWFASMAQVRDLGSHNTLVPHSAGVVVYRTQGPWFNL